MATEIERVDQIITEQRWIYRLGGVPYETISKAGKLFSIAEYIAQKLGLTVVNRIDHRWTPHGFTGGLVLGQSHELWHTWPELRYMSIDLCTCAPNLDLSQAQQLIVAHYNPSHFGMAKVDTPQLVEIFREVGA